MNQWGDGDDIEGMNEKAERRRVPQRFELDPVAALQAALGTPYKPPATKPKGPASLLSYNGMSVGPYRGTAGVLAGAGAVGKSRAALALAYEVAGGPSPGRAKWCGFEVEGEGPVVYIAAEDAWETVDARAFDMVATLTPEQQARAATRFHVVGLVGLDKTLVSAWRISRELTEDEATRAGVKPRSTTLTEGGDPVHTWPMATETVTGKSALFTALERSLAATKPALVVLDPLAVFGAGEVETDNGAAGDFMAALNGLATASGAAVLLVHHTTKAGRKSGDAAATNVRGSSALTDNARWVAELRTDDDDALTLSITKNNYAAAVDPVRLTGDGVRLRAETLDEAAVREKLAFNRKVAAAVAAAVEKGAIAAAIVEAKKGGVQGTTQGTTQAATQKTRAATKPKLKPRGKPND